MTYFAFLRAINVSGTRKIGMADLRQWMTDLGYGEAKTLLQTGNLVFDGGSRSPRETEVFLRDECEKRLGLSTEFFVRTADELSAIIAGNPFRREAADDPSHLLVLFGGGTATPEQEDSLRARIKGREYFQSSGCDYYFVYPDGIGESKLTIKIIERELGVSVTGRNWNTVLKLGAMI
ncbi:MAG: DUF1697 domain-containing protein [Armatimonadetes bacterium]|nr:DUF1697 domain-containing protein [Armatimonadota bacterium]